MADKFITMFNKKLLEFTNDLKTVLVNLPELQSDIGRMSSGLTLMLTLSARSPFDLFNKLVYVPYGSYIVDRNEAFFLSTNYEQFSGDVSMNVIDTLKKAWSQFSIDNKNAIFDHLNLLIAISKKIQGS